MKFKIGNKIFWFRSNNIWEKKLLSGLNLN